MIGLIQSTGNLDVPRSDRQSIWLVATYGTRDLVSEIYAVLKHTIWEIKKVDLTDADRMRSCDLLSGTKLCGPLGRALVNASLPAGKNQIGNVDATRRPRRNG